MRCLIVKPGMSPDTIDIPNELENLQAAVGGYIEAVTLSNTAALLVNEDGKNLGLPFNRVLLDKRCFLRDTLVGNILIVGVDGEEFTSLNKAQCEFYAYLFRNNMVYL